MAERESSGEEEVVDGSEARASRTAKNVAKLKKVATTFASDARRADVETLRQGVFRMGHKVALVILIDAHGIKEPGTSRIIPQLIYMSQTHDCANFSSPSTHSVLERKIQGELRKYRSDTPIPSEDLYTIIGQHLQTVKASSIAGDKRVHDLDYMLSQGIMGWSGSGAHIANRSFTKADPNPVIEAAASIKILYKHDHVECDRRFRVGYNLFDEQDEWTIQNILVQFGIPEGMYAVFVSTACERFDANEEGKLEDSSPRETGIRYAFSKGELRRPKRSRLYKKNKRVRSKKLTSRFVLSRPSLRIRRLSKRNRT